MPIFICPKLIKKGFARPERDHSVCIDTHCPKIRAVVTEADGRPYKKFFCSFRTWAEKLAQRKELRKAK